MRYMLDTNISIYAIKRSPPLVVARLQSLAEGDAVMSVVSYAELRAGLESQAANRARDEHILALLTSRIPVLPFDEAAAVIFGALRSAMRNRRRDAFDRLIAAHAISLGVTLVTDNEADFKGYPGLIVENWVADAPKT